MNCIHIRFEKNSNPNLGLGCGLPHPLKFLLAYNATQVSSCWSIQGLYKVFPQFDYVRLTTTIKLVRSQAYARIYLLTSLKVT
jgi:hypothetical protein